MGRLKLFGAVLSAMQIDATGRIAIVYLDHEMARAAGGTYEDTEGLINLPLTVKEIQAVVFFKQIEGDEYRVSMRSKGDIDIGARREGVRRRRPQERRRLHGDRRDRRAAEAVRREDRGTPIRVRGASPDRMDGLLVIDKPAGPTSHDVVARVRRALGERRIGHTGTLDPLASGVLPLVVGRATRLARFLSASDKSVRRRRPRSASRPTPATRTATPIGDRRHGGAAAGARGDRPRARRVSRHVPAAAAGVLGEEDRGTPQLRARARAGSRDSSDERDAISPWRAVARASVRPARAAVTVAPSRRRYASTATA